MIYPTKKFRVIAILGKTRITKSTSMVLRPEVFVAAHHGKKNLSTSLYSIVISSSVVSQSNSSESVFLENGCWIDRIVEVDDNDGSPAVIAVRHRVLITNLTWRRSLQLFPTCHDAQSIRNQAW